MTGEELYEMIGMPPGPGDRIAKLERKAAIIEVLNDALDAAWEAGCDAVREEH